MAAITVKEAFERYCASVSIFKKGYLQEKSRIAVICRTFLGELAVDKVKSSHIAKYRDHRLFLVSDRTKKKLSPSTVRAELMLLRHFFEICRVEWGYCQENPCLYVKKPKLPQSRDRRLTNGEAQRIMDYASNDLNLYSIITVALETAMRQGEIINLKWEDVNINKRIASLSDTKNGSKRDVPLSLEARDAILRMREITSGFTGRIFTFSSTSIKYAWRKMVRHLGIVDLRFHDLRHEAISRFFEKDRLDVMEVAAISGHKSLSMLKRYTHLKAENLVKKLDGSSMTATKRALIARLQAYPAVAEEHPDGICVYFPDFGNLEVFGKDMTDALESASRALMGALIRSILDDIKIPGPGTYMPLNMEKCARLITIEPFLDQSFYR